MTHSVSNAVSDTSHLTTQTPHSMRGKTVLFLQLSELRLSWSSGWLLLAVQHLGFDSRSENPKSHVCVRFFRPLFFLGSNIKAAWFGTVHSSEV